MASSSHCCYEIQGPYRRWFATNVDSETRTETTMLPQSSSSSSMVPPDHDQSPIEAFVFCFQLLRYKYVRVKDNGRDVFYDSEEKHNVKFAQFEFSLFKSYQCAFRRLSQCLSYMGIDSDHHGQILREAICHYGKMNTPPADKCIPFEGRKIMPIWIHIETTVLSYSHDQCLISRATGVAQSDMVPACEMAVEEQVHRVDMAGDCLTGFAGTECSICLEKFNMKEESAKYLATIPCSHVFHENCIRRWLKKNHYCPLCRFKIQFQLHTDCYS